MAKIKVKTIPFENAASEPRPGYWEWKLGGRTWYFDLNVRGLNCGVIGDGVLHEMVYLDKLEKAAIFAEGYTAGSLSGKLSG